MVFTLINLAVSAFALTSLDSVARVGRLSFQEFFLDSDTDEENMSPFLKVVTNKYFATVITLVLGLYAYESRICRDMAAVWFCKPAVIRTCTCCVCCILKEDKTSGLHALDPDGIHDGSYLYSTWNDDHKTFKSTVLQQALILEIHYSLIFAVLLLILGVLVAIQGVKKLLEKQEA